MTPAAQLPLTNSTAPAPVGIGEDKRVRSMSRGALAFLAFAPPAIAELLSGSAPPLRFFHPIALCVLVLLYGGGTLLVRELRVRWGLQWAVLLPAIAYGILEEGTAVQSFFNHNHVDLKVLAHYGVAGGVHWPWTMQLIFFHATVSTLIPIAIADLLWPELRDRPLLRRRGWILTSIGLVAVTLFFWLVVSQAQRGMAQPYHMSALLIGGSLLAIAALLFGALQIGHPSATRRHRFALVFGSLIFFVLLTPIQEFAPQVNPDPTSGMLAVGFAALGLLGVLWRRLRRAAMSQSGL